MKTMCSVLVLYQEGPQAGRLEAILSRLSLSNRRIAACHLEGACGVDDRIGSEILDQIDATDNLIIAGLPLHILKRIVGLDDEHPLSAAVLYALAAGLDVAMVREAVDPRLYLRSKGYTPPGLDRQIEKLLENVVALGVTLIAEAELDAQPIGRANGGIVTLKDIQQTVLNNSEDLDRLRQARLTPAAKDWLSEHQRKQILRGEVI